MSLSALPSHMCVYFAKENAFQVVADRTGKFRNKLVEFSKKYEKIKCITCTDCKYIYYCIISLPIYNCIQ